MLFDLSERNIYQYNFEIRYLFYFPTVMLINEMIDVIYGRNKELDNIVIINNKAFG